VTLVMAHSATREEGLETAFMGLAVGAVLVSFLVIGIPDRAGQRVGAPVPGPSAQPAGGDG
jgi:hypothetical protein